MKRHLIAMLLLCASAISGRAEIERHYYATGNMRDTALHVGADFAGINDYAAVEIRASIPDTKQQQSPWNECFGIRFHQTSPNDYWQATLTPANTDYGSLADEAGMQLIVSVHRPFMADSIV